MSTSLGHIVWLTLWTCTLATLLILVIPFMSCSARLPGKMKN